LSTQPGSWPILSTQIPDDTTPIRDAIISGSLIAVSDGSCKDTYGTAAWILYAAPFYLSGQVVCPGAAKDQNSYRSEIAGLLAILNMVDALVSFYNIPAGSIKVACDVLSALNRVFSDISTLSIDEPCFYLLVSARHLRLSSPLLWKHRHVKGHQDAATPKEQLDIYSRLNIKMDLRAKEHFQVAQCTPRHYFTINEPWSLWFSGLKINDKLDDSIYEIAHSAQAREYWQTKRDLPDVIFDDIHWTALHQARKSAPLQTTTFITKHSVGMCGVGTFLGKEGLAGMP
jgi:hypothetical protein